MMAERRQTRPRRPQGLPARPLDSLLFLLPMIAFYEAYCLLAAPAGSLMDGDRVVAFRMLQVFFELFGVTGMWMPGLAVVAILLATQVVSGQPWQWNKRSVGLMYVESVLWALPLLALNRFTQMAAGDVPVQPLIGNIALCVGAGIYEELVFRLAIISLFTLIGVDLLRFSYGSTLVAGVLVSAGLFALHHHPPFGIEPYDAFRFTFRALAGVYLGVIFVLRGYGPAAGAHIGYNLLIIALSAR